MFRMITKDLNVWVVLKRTMIVFLPVVILISIITIIIHQFEVKIDLMLIKDRENSQIKMLTEVIANDFELVVSDLLYLSSRIRSEGLFNNTKKSIKKALFENFLSFGEAKKIYDQIRYIDENGMEIARINYHKGQPLIVPQDRLKLQLNRYYFEDTFQLEFGEVYVSPFDLNIELGSIELPFKPMIRFGTPIFNDKRKKKGILLLNYNGNTILQNIKKMTAGNMGDIMLLNSDGYWLMNPNPDDEWGFMFEDRINRTMGNRFPKAWQIMTSNTSGQFRDQNGLLTFKTINPIGETFTSSTDLDKDYHQGARNVPGKKYYWKIASFIPHDKLVSKLNDDVNIHLLFNVMLFVLAFIGSGIITIVRMRREIAVKKIKQQAVFVNQNPAPVIRTSSSGTILVTNPAANKLFNKSIVGERLQNILPDLWATYATMEIKSNLSQVENIIENKVFLFTILKEENTKSIYLFGADITERKQLEKALQNANSIKETLLDVITHDLKNPAGVIQGMSEIMMEEQPKNEMVEVIKNCSDSLLKVIDNATVLSQVALGDEIKMVDTNLAEVLQEIAEEWKPALDDADMTLEIDLPNRISIQANPIISEVFKNYISNAIKYASKGKKILINSEEGDSSLTINVKDFGETLPEVKRQPVFIRGMQLEEGKKRGRGLGLAIVKRIAEAHNAEVGVKPNKPKGNIFYVTFPFNLL